MHPAQRRAIIAIISMIETGLQQLKGMLLTADSQQGVPMSVAQAAAPQSDGILSEAEEASLETMMENHRKSLLNESENLAQRFFAEDEGPE